MKYVIYTSYNLQIRIFEILRCSSNFVLVSIFVSRFSKKKTKTRSYSFLFCLGGRITRRFDSTRGCNSAQFNPTIQFNLISICDLRAVCAGVMSVVRCCQSATSFVQRAARELNWIVELNWVVEWTESSKWNEKLYKIYQIYKIYNIYKIYKIYKIWIM